MNKNLLMGIVVAIAILGAGFLFLSNRPAQPPTTPPVTTDESMQESVMEKEVTVTLSEQNASGESGVATLTEVDGKVKVTLAMTGMPATVSQPAHIHVGRCPEVGAVKYPLESPVDGVSEITLAVTLDQLKSELPLAINVHKSVEEVSTYVSCGDLQF